VDVGGGEVEAVVDEQSDGGEGVVDVGGHASDDLGVEEGARGEQGFELYVHALVARGQFLHPVQLPAYFAHPGFDEVYFQVDELDALVGLPVAAGAPDQVYLLVDIGGLEPAGCLGS
jgi:hypothetical protein